MNLPIVVSDEEALELHRFTLHDYISPKKHPALMQLLERVGARVTELHRQGVSPCPASSGLIPPS